MLWLPPPSRGTSVCGGFDGSENDDLTVIKLETKAGHLFTPRWGADSVPTIWRASDHGGGIPRGQVRAAWLELNDFYDIRRVYCDPGFNDETSWESDIEWWDTAMPFADGSTGRFASFPTTSGKRMFSAVRRFEADLSTFITHDGCPTTTAHMRNARKIFGRGRTYTLGKPSAHQKIDSAVTSVIAHEAASDERAAGWPDETDSRVFCFT